MAAVLQTHRRIKPRSAFRIVFVGETRLTGHWKTVGMSAADGNLQAQVESVLGALVKAATSELIRLFEGRCGASALAPDAFTAEPRARHKTADTIRAPSTSTSKHSIGVQVDLDLCSPPEIFGKKVSKHHHFLLSSPTGLIFNPAFLFIFISWRLHVKCLPCCTAFNMSCCICTLRYSLVRWNVSLPSPSPPFTWRFFFG